MSEEKKGVQWHHRREEEYNEIREETRSTMISEKRRGVQWHQPFIAVQDLPVIVRETAPLLLISHSWHNFITNWRLSLCVYIYLTHILFFPFSLSPCLSLCLSLFVSFYLSYSHNYEHSLTDSLSSSLSNSFPASFYILCQNWKICPLATNNNKKYIMGFNR